jgi:hypothetical protein
VHEKKPLNLAEINDQFLIALPNRLLPDLIVPFSELINALFLVISSYLFLTGFTLKKRSSSLSVGQRKVSNTVQENIHAHVEELASQGSLGTDQKQRASHYPHTSVPDHASRIVNEGKFQQLPKKGIIYKGGQTGKIGTPEGGTAKTYDAVATLRQAAEKTGIERDEILTTREIEAEYNINKKLIHEYTRRGRQGRPHLTPLPVRLKGSGLGGGQLLFRREDIERLVANPPKPGPPRK